MVASNYDLLRQLVTEPAGPRVSVYLPVNRAAPEENRIRLKNLLNEAGQQLRGLGWTPPRVDEFLECARDNAEHSVLRAPRTDGVALLRSQDECHVVELSYPCETKAVVSEHYYVKPLLRDADHADQFFVLRFAQKGVRLLEGDRFNIRPLDAPDLPDSIDRLLEREDPDIHNQWRTPSQGAGGGPAPKYHGHGPPMEAHEDSKLPRFCRMVDRAVAGALRNERAPLVLAAVEHVAAVYRSVNTYPRLLEPFVAGSPDPLPDSALRERAWPIVEPVLTAERRAALDLLHAAADKGLASARLEELLPAATAGRIETLFTEADAPGVERRGTFDPQSGAVRFTDDGEDLLNLAAVLALQFGGGVYACRPGELEDKSPVAAIYRW